MWPRRRRPRPQPQRHRSRSPRRRIRSRISIPEKSRRSNPAMATWVACTYIQNWLGHFLQGSDGQTLQPLRSRIDCDPCVFESDDAQDGLGTFGTKDDLAESHRVHEVDTCRTYWILDDLAVGELVGTDFLRLDTGLRKQRGRQEAVDGTGVNEESGFDGFAAAIDWLDACRDVRETHAVLPCVRFVRSETHRSVLESP